MNYAPGVQPEAGNYIMQGLAMSQRNGEMMARLMGYLIDRGQQKDAAAATIESLAGAYPGGAMVPDGTGTVTGQPAGNGGGGFNPVAGGGAAAGGDGGEADGPSPAAQAGQRAESIRKLVQAYAPGAKDLHAGLKAMSLGQLEGMLKGYTLKQAGAEQQARIQEFGARMQDYQAQGRLRDQQVADDQTVGKLLHAYGNYDPGTDEEGNALAASPGERIQFALKQVPEAGGRVLPKALEALTQYEKVLNPKQGEDLTPGTFTVPGSGAIFAYRGKQFLPAGVDPKLAPKPEIVPQHDEEGNLVGWSSPTGKGGWTFTPAKSGSPTFKQARDEDGNVLPGFYVDPKGNKLDARDALTKAGLGGLTGASGAGGKLAAGNAGAGSERVTVKDKGGKEFTVPREQLSEAQKHGYTLVK